MEPLGGERKDICLGLHKRTLLWGTQRSPAPARQRRTAWIRSRARGCTSSIGLQTMKREASRGDAQQDGERKAYHPLLVVRLLPVVIARCGPARSLHDPLARGRWAVGSSCGIPQVMPAEVYRG